MIATKSESALWTTDQITEAYNTKYKFYNLADDNIAFKIAFNYIIKNFKVQMKYNEFIDFVNRRKSDAEVYNFLRQRYTSDTNKAVEDHDEIYKSKHIVNKVKTLYDSVSKYGPFNRILDIGTEDHIFLDKVGEKFNIKMDEDNYVKGLNIIDGYPHYSLYEEAVKSGKVILYDGINIPFTSAIFDMVILISVLHHVENIEEFLTKVCKITKSIYIKDNDMSTTQALCNRDIQHELYEGILCPSVSRSSLTKITNGQILGILRKNGFNVLVNDVSIEFTRPMVIFAQKK